MASYIPASNLLGPLGTTIAQTQGVTYAYQNGNVYTQYTTQVATGTQTVYWSTESLYAAQEALEWAHWRTQQINEQSIMRTYGRYMSPDFAEPVPTPVPVPESRTGPAPEQVRVRAQEVLLRFLSPAQREQWEKVNHFDVQGSLGNWYRLERPHGAHFRLSTDRTRRTHSFCIHTHGLPREDELLGFKALLEANEAEFLRVANVTVMQ